MDGLLRRAVIASGGSAIRVQDYLKKITQTVGQERNYGKIRGIGNGPFNYAEKESPVMGSLFVKKIIILMVDYFNPRP